MRDIVGIIEDNACASARELSRKTGLEYVVYRDENNKLYYTSDLTEVGDNKVIYRVKQ